MPDTPAADSLGETFTRKVGPLPLGAWVVGGGVVVGGVMWWRKRKQPNTGDQGTVNAGDVPPIAPTTAQLLASGLYPQPQYDGGQVVGTNSNTPSAPPTTGPHTLSGDSIVDQIVNAYVTYLGRAPQQWEVQYWQGTGRSIDTIVTQIANSGEAAGYAARQAAAPAPVGSGGGSSRNPASRMAPSAPTRRLPAYVVVQPWPSEKSTLRGIARKARVPLAVVEQLNPQIKDPNALYAGQSVRVA